MDTLLLLVKIGMVFGLLALVLWVLKRTDGLGGRAKNNLLEVRGTTRLTKGAALTVVRVDGKDLLIGVTDHTVTLLTAEPAVEGSVAVPQPRRALLPALRQPKAGVSAQDVAAALATLRGESPELLPVRADGTAATSTTLANRRRVARTDARRDEEHPWSHACRPAFRTADGDDAVG